MKDKAKIIKKELSIEKIRERFKELFSDEIDWNNSDKLAKDLWLFLTPGSKEKLLPDMAVIKREAFFHEVKSMLDAVRDICSKRDAIAFATFMENGHYYTKVVKDVRLYCKATGPDYTKEELYLEYNHQRNMEKINAFIAKGIDHLTEDEAEQLKFLSDNVEHYESHKHH